VPVGGEQKARGVKQREQRRDVQRPPKRGVCVYVHTAAPRVDLRSQRDRDEGRNRGGRL
jgi:hypothetical protein